MFVPKQVHAPPSEELKHSEEPLCEQSTTVLKIATSKCVGVNQA